jgi:hypothetical protein
MELLSEYKIERNEIKENIVIKNENKDLTDYKETQHSNSIRNEIKKINLNNKKHVWTIVLKENDLVNIPSCCIESYNSKEGELCTICNPFSCKCLNSFNSEGKVLLQNLTLFPPQYKRVFRTNKHKFNKLELWDLHGRFYDNLQNIPKELRKQIRIDGEETVECDFSSLHISIAYSLEGFELPTEDLYKIEGYERNIVKKAVVILLNTENIIQAKKAMAHEESNLFENINLTDLINKIISKHSSVQKYFSSSFGLKAMNYDSNIASNCLKAFVGLNKPIMCIHDSFIVKASDEVLIKSIMVASFQKVLNTKNIPGIK